jgi:hypothetical protein
MAKNKGWGLAAFPEANETVSVDATRCVFERNKNLSTRSPNTGYESGLGGGGILAFAEGSGVIDMVVRDSVLQKNKSLAGGGAVDIAAIQSGQIDAEFVNSVFSKNRLLSTLSHGGGFHLSSRDASTVAADIVNCTIVDNKATDSGGIRVSSQDTSSNTMNLKNDIIFGNDAGDVSISAIAGTTTAVNSDHNDIGSLSGDPDATFNDLGGNISADDPLLEHRVHLSSTSPAIDVGTCTGAPSADLEGDPRPTGSGCDIGADEFVP